MAGKKPGKARVVKRASAKLEEAKAKPRAKTAARKPPAEVTRTATRPGASSRSNKPKEAEALTAKAAPKPRRGLPKPVTAPVAITPVAKARSRGRTRPEPRPVVIAGPAETLTTPTALTEEERIESSKYDVRERPRRVFEEERFLFPETYESDRVRLLVKDPEWLFAHWDVSPGSLQRLRDDLGERATALSRLTLRLEDPADSALSVVLLPEGARSWYVRTHAAHRAYRAALGVTMPSGEFRPLATSNVVLAPRGAPSPQRARRRVAFSRAQSAQAAAELERGGFLSASAPERTALANGDSQVAGAVDYIDAVDESQRPDPAAAERGGASEQLGGASDVFRR